MDPLVHSLGDEPCEDHRVASVHRGVGDPVLLGRGGGRVDHKLLGSWVVGRRGEHLDGIVPVPELSQRKAAYLVQAVDGVHHFAVPLCAQLQDGPPEQVELHGQLCGRAAVHKAHHLVRGKDVGRVAAEVFD